MEYSWRVQALSLCLVAARAERRALPPPLDFWLLRGRSWRDRGGGGGYVEVLWRCGRRQDLLLAARGRRRVDVHRFVQFILDFARGLLEFLDALAEAASEFRQFLGAE